MGYYKGLFRFGRYRDEVALISSKVAISCQLDSVIPANVLVDEFINVTIFGIIELTRWVRDITRKKLRAEIYSYP